MPPGPRPCRCYTHPGSLQDSKAAGHGLDCKQCTMFWLLFLDVAAEAQGGRAEIMGVLAGHVNHLDTSRFLHVYS